MKELCLITVILCLTYCFKLVMVYINPYEDELINKEKLYDSDNDIVGYSYYYKRKYKNGKIKFVSKNIKP